MAESEKTAPAAAIGYSMVTNLPGDRQMTVQCFVGEGEADDVVNARFDRIFGFIDRQKARYELDDLTEERVKLEEALAQFEEDLGRIETEHSKALADLNVQVIEITKRRDEVKKAAYDAFTVSGRRGQFKPVGADASNIGAAEAALKQIEDQRVKLVNEREQHIGNVNISLARHRKGLANCEERIASRKALLEGS